MKFALVEVKFKVPGMIAGILLDIMTGVSSMGKVRRLQVMCAQ